MRTVEDLPEDVAYCYLLLYKIFDDDIRNELGEIFYCADPYKELDADFLELAEAARRAECDPKSKTYEAAMNKAVHIFG